MTILRYNYKLRPGASALAALRREYGRVRWVWNEAVYTARSKQNPTEKKLSSWLTQARKELPWLAEGSVVCQQQTLRDFIQARTDSFRIPGRGYPRPKTRKSHPYVSLNYTTRGFSLPRVSDEEGVERIRLRLAKVGDIPVVWSRELPSTPKSVRVYEDACGDFWASFTVEVQSPAPLEPTGKAVGFDFGVAVTVTASEDHLDLPFHSYRKTVSRGIARQSRRMAVLQKKRDAQSKKQYAAAQKRAARLHRKATRQASDAAYKWAHKVCREADTLCIEDFKPKFLASTTMARKASEARVGTVKSTLLAVAAKTGRTTVLIHPAYTTQDCSSCGSRLKTPLTLKDRTYHCSSCGAVKGRDRNAAVNMLRRAGFIPAESAPLDTACGSPQAVLVNYSGIPRL